jgi:tocopherol cyclase
LFLPESFLSAYRRTGADPPFGDPRGHHGVPMEGYFWRITDAASGRVVVAFTAVNRDGAGASWATIGLAAHPGGFVRTAVVDHAEADPRRLGVRAGGMLRADEGGVDVDLGPGARLRVHFARRVGWPRALGGVGIGHLVPGLGQYWHPHMLDACVAGTAELDGRTLELSGARAYAEKNWTPYAHGFPSEWWWGQAQAFADDDVCVAFAGGRLHGLGAGAVIVRLGDELIRVTGPPAPLRMALGDGTWRLRARTARHVVTVEGSADGAPYMLPVPKPRERRAQPEVSAMHLAGRLRVRVRRGGRLRFDGTSSLAGLEQGRE